MQRQSAKTKRSRTTTAAQDKCLYTLEVFLIGGPLADAFVEQNPVVSRTIEIRADQTLAELHGAIFRAFDREEQHLYEFQVGGQGPQDPNAKCYVLPMAMKDIYGGSKPAGDVTRTRLGSIGLAVDDASGYWFDCGGGESTAGGRLGGGGRLMPTDGPRVRLSLTMWQAATPSQGDGADAEATVPGQPIGAIDEAHRRVAGRKVLGAAACQAVRLVL